MVVLSRARDIEIIVFLEPVCFLEAHDRVIWLEFWGALVKADFIADFILIETIHMLKAFGLRNFIRWRSF